MYYTRFTKALKNVIKLFRRKNFTAKQKAEITAKFARKYGIPVEWFAGSVTIWDDFLNNLS